MNPSEWAVEQIEVLARHHRIVWVEDPYSLIEETEMASLQNILSRKGYELAHVGNAFQLRQMLDVRDSSAAKLILIDQSYTLYNPHLLPKDAKPSDLRPLSAPDWKPLVSREALFRPTIRDFLTYVTGDDRWPAEVNIYPYEKLARDDPQGFVRAYETFRRTGRTLTTEDLVMVGASAVLGINLFDVNSSLDALELAFHSGEHWQSVQNLFNREEYDVIKRRLQALPLPMGELFGEKAQMARMALTALILLRQHDENPGRHLPFLSPVLTPYRDCQVERYTETPSWFISDEVPEIERLMGKEFNKYIYSQWNLDDPERAKIFAQNERFSNKFRSLVPFAIQELKPSPYGTDRKQRSGDDFRLDRLVPEFQETKRQLTGIINTVKRDINRLQLTPLQNQTASKYLDIFDQKEFYKVDQLMGRLDSLMRYIEGPAKAQWKLIVGFEQRWEKEVRECRDLIGNAVKLGHDLDYLFGKLMESRYDAIVPNEILPTDLFYQKFIGPRRRGVHGEIRKAVVLVFDSMRLDIWRQLVRPALEREYIVEESIGFACLPSETTVSRRAFFAGQSPGKFPKVGPESNLFADQLSRFHATKISLENVAEKRPGLVFGCRSNDNVTYTGVFDFADRLAHDVDWDPHTIQEALKPLLREVKAVLAEAGKETLVFLTSDHGHVRQLTGRPIYLDHAEDVGYRSAYVIRKVEGEHAAHVFQIPATTLRHEREGWFVFPKPGYYLRDAGAAGKGRPGAGYRHGGLTLFETVVPLAYLRHRDVPTAVYLNAVIRETPVAGQPCNIDISISADGVVTSPVRLESSHADLESTVVSGVSSTPVSVSMRFNPTAPGRCKATISAWLADQEVGSTTIDVIVTPAPEPEDPAKAKLKKLFGG